MKFKYKLEEISKVSQIISEKIKNGGVLALFGNIGSGKTTLSKEIAKDLNIKNWKVKSPTYTYIRRYPEKNFYHIDLYRLEKADQTIFEEINEIQNYEKNIIIIEWPELYNENLPRKAIKAYLKYISENTREIEISF